MFYLSVFTGIEQAILSYLAKSGEPTKTWEVINTLAKDSYLKSIQAGVCYDTRRIKISESLNALIRAGAITRKRSRTEHSDNVELNTRYFHEN